MEKQIGKWSYFLGVATVVIAVVWRLLAMLQLAPKQISTLPHTISYKTLQEGAFLLFAITVATAAYVYTQKHNS